MHGFAFSETFCRGGLREASAALALAQAIRPAAAETPWCVLTVAGDGAAAAVALERLGVLLWRPQRLVKIGKRRGHPARLVRRALFEGYLFVRFGGGRKAVAAVLRADGVTGILAVDGAPKPVPHEVVMELMRAHDRGAFDDSLLTACGKARLKPGDAVKIKEGPFAGFPATFLEGYAGTRLARLEVDIFGRAARTTISLDDFESQA